MSIFSNDFDLLGTIKSAESGDINSIRLMAVYLACEGEDEEDLQEMRIRYLKQLEEVNDGVGLIMLGDAYLKGVAVEADAYKAFESYEKAVENGVDYGNECIGQMFYFGKGFPVDYERAFKYLTKNEEIRSAETKYLLGEMYREGKSVAQDCDKAFGYYKEIADKESIKNDDYYPAACFRTAKYYADRKNKEYSLQLAEKYINRARDTLSENNRSAAEVGVTKKQVDELWVEIIREIDTQ